MFTFWKALVTSLALLFLLGAARANTTSTSTVFVYQPRQLSVAEYEAELDHLSSLANQAGKGSTATAKDEAVATMRGGWKVVTPTQTFEVETGWLIDQFEKLGKSPDDQTRNNILTRIQLLKTDLAAFQQTPADNAAMHASLTKILSRSEFHQVEGPTWLDRLKYRIFSWIFRILERFFGSSSVPVVGKVFVWVLVGVAVLVLAFFVYRTLKQNARLESVVPAGIPVSAKQWRVWMDEAHAAANQGLWREAVHLAYWAGISFLEESGMWRPDKARTPREYLRLLPTASQHRPSLSTLTRQLEVTWYGNQTAGPETFSETLKLLENLGCHQA